MKNEIITLSLENYMRSDLLSTPGRSMYRKHAGLYLVEEMFIREIYRGESSWLDKRFGENKFSFSLYERCASYIRASRMERWNKTKTDC